MVNLPHTWIRFGPFMTHLNMYTVHSTLCTNTVDIRDMSPHFSKIILLGELSKRNKTFGQFNTEQTCLVVTLDCCRKYQVILTEIFR